MIVESPSVLHEDLSVYCRSSLVIRPKEGGRVIPLELNFAQEIVDRECPVSYTHLTLPTNREV